MSSRSLGHEWRQFPVSSNPIQYQPNGMAQTAVISTLYLSAFFGQFLESFLNDGQRLRLAVRMKGLFRAVMGNPTGFYMLDLASAQGRMTAIKVRGYVRHGGCLFYDWFPEGF